MKLPRRAASAALSALAVVAGSLLVSQQAQALPDSEHPVYVVDCQPVEAVFARGSGQQLLEPASTSFRDKLGAALGPVAFNFYELGWRELGGKQYPAVNVSDVGNGNAIGGWFSGGQKNDYGESVDEGAAEAEAYLKARGEKCPNSVFVMGGFSQGAQVIGETYENIDSSLRSRIAYNALFGDPKLYLPEGELRGGYTPACRGEGFSAWRFDVPDCTLDSGSLGKRDPYLPEGWTDKTGLWCNDDDFVCGSRLMLGGDGHKYDGEDTAAAVVQIVNRLRTALPAGIGELIPDHRPGAVGTTGLDMVFVVDTTGSMGDQIDDALETVASMSGWVEKMRGRVALVEYRDAGDEFTARILSGLQGDTTEISAKLDGLTVGGGGDSPEALLHALMTTFNGLEWRDGATKAAVVLTDAGFHDPDQVDGTTLDQVARRALEIDPVNVYPVVDPWMAESYQPLAEATSGQVISNDEADTAAALQSALTRIEERPVALLPLVDYYVPVGEAATFDASRSYANGGAEIASYDWDFNGDGVFDTTTETPVQTHAYTEAGETVMQVRVTDTNGLIANMSAFVHVGTPPIAVETIPGAPVDVTADIIDTDGALSSVALGWTPTEPLGQSWVVAIDDFPLGRVDVGEKSVNISEVDRTEPVVLGVAGVNANGEVGEYGTVVLPAIDEDPAAPAPTDPPSPSPAPSEPTDPPSPSPSNPPASSPAPSKDADPTPMPTTTPGTVMPAGSDKGTGSDTKADPLAATGANVGTALMAGAVLLGAGALVMLLRRRFSRP